MARANCSGEIGVGWWLWMSMTPGVSSWAICDKPYTVAVSRLFPERAGIPRLPATDFNAILSKLLEWLPTPTP